MTMFFFEIEATPSSGDENDLEGAFVNCWIDATDLDAALVTAQKEIRQAGWTPVRVNRSAEARREHFTSSAALAYYEQALLDKAVLVFHAFPTDDGGE